MRGAISPAKDGRLFLCLRAEALERECGRVAHCVGVSRRVDRNRERIRECGGEFSDLWSDARNGEDSDGPRRSRCLGVRDPCGRTGECAIVFVGEHDDRQASAGLAWEA